MGRKQKSKTPQPQKGQNVMAKAPQSAPAGKKPLGNKGGNQTPNTSKAKPQVQNGKGNNTPKPGDKRKLDMGKPQTPNKKQGGTPAPFKGKGTPAKTPKTPVGGLQGKPKPGRTPQQMVKAMTPKQEAKTPKQEPKTPKTPPPSAKGAKNGKKTPQKAAEDSDEDEDDDDDDDDMEDFEIDDEDDDEDDEGESLEEDMDDDDDDEEDDDEDEPTPKKQKAVEEDDDEDDDDEEDDEEEDEDDDDDDDEIDEDAILQQIKAVRKEAEKLGQIPAVKQEQKAKGKQQEQQQPQDAKKAEKKEKKKAEKQKKNEIPKGPTISDADASTDALRKEDRDKRTLFLKNLAQGVTVTDVRALSKDIQEVRLRIALRGKHRQNKKKVGFAYVEFATEAAADKNYKALQGTKLKDSEIFIDYVGEKSTHKSVKSDKMKETADPDPLRLYVTGFGSDVKEADMYKLFAKANDIAIPKRKKDKSPLGFAFISFATADQCKTAHDKCQGSKIRDHNLVVLYAKKRSIAEQEKDRKKALFTKEGADKQKKSGLPAKKAKLDVKKEEEEDDDDEDDDDEEDEDEDDDDDEDGEGDEDEDDDDDDGEEDGDDDEDEDEEDDDDDDDDDDE